MIGGKEHAVDMRAINPYKKVLSHGGRSSKLENLCFSHHRHFQLKASRVRNSRRIHFAKITTKASTRINRDSHKILKFKVLNFKISTACQYAQIHRFLPKPFWRI